ncbi:MAG: type I methionyl aminopeptidase [Candidatus Jidaibacter sp.]|jgi:methionyl aminopeptidase|nr:type I methionyl aminopeptidase [Candidatus Jidaibacter sp.]
MHNGKSKKSTNVKIYSASDYEGMRKAGELAAEVLDYITDFINPGVTTGKLNELCHNMIIERGAIPAPLNYNGFPKSICTSINHVICHGIPSDKKLQNGDIMNIDVTVILDGYYGDSSRMYYAGKPSIKGARLTQVTYECLMLAIEEVRPGAKFNQIGKVIQQHAHKHGYSVVRDFCGHGIGTVFHDAPQILHYYDPGLEGVMEEGMFFTIEPMINAGGWESLVLADGWTAVTKDRSLSAQFEHTLAVTKDGVEIFTTSPKDIMMPAVK